MDYSKPTLILISGPPGAGKSTFGKTLLPDAFEGISPFDRDATMTKYEQELIGSYDDPDEIANRAFIKMERQLIDEMATAIQHKAHYALETPLHFPDYWEEYINPFLNNGYQIQLSYICLDNLSDCEARVHHRANTGGHWLPLDTIEEVYKNSLPLLEANAHLLTAINLYDGMKTPTLLANIENGLVVHAEPEALTKNWITHGLPTLAAKISKHLPPPKISNRIKL
ncbi:AAA family ATPase [Chitinophaga oryziterrae]|uniref:AAA family ATPase n=1 Tax=Chitinophaga oryziterrae TaxID=1031224 RepID=A0A6N8J7P4_9BACT|nr:AAA family ATPase [Chitinophaga oryziterrae]MVT40286.1 AAA family ATPase [Chitinophaga oryziterrae]